jgi:hemin uptake protein HemP
MHSQSEPTNRTSHALTTNVDAARRDIPVIDNRVDSRTLFGTAREIIIAHGPDMYRLRLTAQNKLILTK